MLICDFCRRQMHRQQTMKNRSPVHQLPMAGQELLYDQHGQPYDPNIPYMDVQDSIDPQHHKVYQTYGRQGLRNEYTEIMERPPHEVNTQPVQYVIQSWEIWPGYGKWNMWHTSMWETISHKVHYATRSWYNIWHAASVTHSQCNIWHTSSH